jgi:membrane protease YdiL (CAAX protease family)
MSNDEQLAALLIVEEPLEESTCWRCGLGVPTAASNCPHCAAVLSPAASARTERRIAAEDTVKALIVSFVILLLSGLFHGGVLGFIVGDRDTLDAQLRRQVLYEMLAIEIFDTIIVAAVILKYGYRQAGDTHLTSRRTVAWIMALPALGGLLALNVAYHWALRTYLNQVPLDDELTATIDALLIAVYCIQPAIVEEFYFRGFALGTLKSISSTAVAIWISAIMFALAHLAVPLSLPYLAVFGLVMGVFRVYSGTIWVPIILHFSHNLAVMLL